MDIGRWEARVGAAKIEGVDAPRVTTLTEARHDRERERRTLRAIEARRSLAGRPRRRGGRAWINGRELGGTDGRYAHLGRSHD